MEAIAQDTLNARKRDRAGRDKEYSPCSVDTARKRHCAGDDNANFPGGAPDWAEADMATIRSLPAEVASLVLDSLTHADAQSCIRAGVFALDDPTAEAARRRCQHAKKRDLARAGDVVALAYLHAVKGARFSLDHVTGAAEAGHLDAAKWLLERTSAVPIPRLLQKAAAGGNPDLVRFVCARATPDADAVAEALAYAAAKGHGEVVDYLCASYGEPRSPVALFLATTKGHHVIAQRLAEAAPRHATAVARVTHRKVTFCWDNDDAKHDDKGDRDDGQTWLLVDPDLTGRLFGGHHDADTTGLSLDMTLLDAACASGDLGAVERLLSTGAVHASRKDAIVWAACGGNRDVVLSVWRRCVAMRARAGDDPNRARGVAMRVALLSRDIAFAVLVNALFDYEATIASAYDLLPCGAGGMRFAIEQRMQHYGRDLVAALAMCDAGAASYLVGSEYVTALADYFAEQRAPADSVMPACGTDADAMRILWKADLVTFVDRDLDEAVSQHNPALVRFLVDECGVGPAPLSKPDTRFECAGCVYRKDPDLFRRLVPDWIGDPATLLHEAAVDIPLPEPSYPWSGVCHMFDLARHDEIDAAFMGRLLDRVGDRDQERIHVDDVICGAVCAGRADLFDAMIRRRRHLAGDDAVFCFYAHTGHTVRADLLARLVDEYPRLDLGECPYSVLATKKALPVLETLRHRGVYDFEANYRSEIACHPARPDRGGYEGLWEIKSRAVVEWLMERGCPVGSDRPAHIDRDRFDDDACFGASPRTAGVAAVREALKNGYPLGGRPGARGQR